MDFGTLSDWVGRMTTGRQTVESWPILGLRALMDEEARAETGEPVPALSQWLFFGPTVRQSKIGADGHPERGDFLPPVPLPRRMWAGSDIRFESPIRVGETLEKVARIADVSVKEGKTGTLVFVKVDNSYSVDGRTVLGEVQTLVYRDHPAPDEAPAPRKSAPQVAEWSRRLTPDPALLFRYSAVTFNAHRIHYDAPYAREEEGYPGIVVQGQLTATLMLREFALNRGDRAPKSFSFRAVRATFADQPLFVEGAADGEDGATLWARDDEGMLIMTGKVGF